MVKVNSGKSFDDSVFKIPLEMIWNPKEDITVYELAMCIKYMNRFVMPNEINKDDYFLRHFEIINRNEK